MITILSLLYGIFVMLIPLKRHWQDIKRVSWASLGVARILIYYSRAVRTVALYAGTLNRVSFSVKSPKTRIGPSKLTGVLATPICSPLLPSMVRYVISFPAFIQDALAVVLTNHIID